AQLLLGPVQQARTHVVEAQRIGRLLAHRPLTMLGELGVNGDGAIDLTALAHQTAERELDVGLVRLGGEAREHLGGTVETIVDEMIETGEVIEVAAQPPATRRTAAERERRYPDQQETQQQDFGADTAQTHARKLSEKRTRSAKITRHENSLVSYADIAAGRARRHRFNRRAGPGVSPISQHSPVGCRTSTRRNGRWPAGRALPDGFRAARGNGERSRGSR